jgi:hypothetical protein
MKMVDVLKGVVIGLAMIGCLSLGVWHGTSLGDVKAIAEYELGYDAGYNDALYQRPVSEALEMVCLGLWFAQLPEKKDNKL